MTVKEKIEEMISSANTDVFKGCMKTMLGGLVMAAGLKMFGDGIQKAERNATLMNVVEATKDAFDEDTLNKPWKGD